MVGGGSETPKAVRPLPAWVPAGWYPDPLGQGAARYWDGTQWTLEYRDSPPPDPVPTSPSEVTASSPPPSVAASGYSPGAQPGLRDRWQETSKGIRILIAGVGLILLIVIIGAMAGGGKNKTTASSEPATAAKASEEQPAAPPVALKLDTGDYSVTSSHTTLHGTVTAGASVTVDGRHASLHGTHWSKTVALEIGSNAMTVEATLTGQESTSDTISVTRHHTEAELEAKQRAREEAQTRREQEAAERVERYKASAVTIPYNQLNKNPEEYVGKVVKYRGQIFQIQEEGGEGIILLSVDEEYEVWSDNIWINFDHHINAAEKDIVTVYGEITGQKSYQTQIGGETYVPEMKAKYIEE